MTEVLLPTHANQKLLSYHDNRFCDTIITLSILLHISTLYCRYNNDATYILFSGFSGRKQPIMITPRIQINALNKLGRQNGNVSRNESIVITVCMYIGN